MINRITHKQFLTLCDHVIEKQVPLKGKPIAIAIADEAGDIVYIVHMDGVPSRSSIIASGKARTAAKMGRDTTAIKQLCQDLNTPISDFLVPGLTTLPGGAPILNKQEDLIGGIGISGMAASEDQEMANYCAKFLQENL